MQTESYHSKGIHFSALVSLTLALKICFYYYHYYYFYFCEAISFELRLSARCLQCSQLAESSLSVQRGSATAINIAVSLERLDGGIKTSIQQSITLRRITDSKSIRHLAPSNIRSLGRMPAVTWHTWPRQQLARAAFSPLVSGAVRLVRFYTVTLRHVEYVQLRRISDRLCSSSCCWCLRDEGGSRPGLAVFFSFVQTLVSATSALAPSFMLPSYLSWNQIEPKQVSCSFSISPIRQKNNVEMFFCFFVFCCHCC